MKKNKLVAIAVFTFLIVLPVVGQSLDKFNRAKIAISKLYVDQVNDDKLVESAIKGMLEKLDPHSTYLDPEEVKEMNEPLQGNFDGIGIQFNMNNDTLYVIQTIVGGPSEKVGIMAGDRVISVNDTAIAGVKMSNNDIMKRLRGRKGTEVDVLVLRKGVKDPIQFRITRDKIPIYSIDASFMADKHTGYIRISRFGATTHQEFVDALKGLKKLGMKDLIIDLQGNGGGYLNSAIDIADELLNDNELIVYTQGRNSPRDNAKSSRGGLFTEGKLVVLVDESSASASEIVSGAVQDWDRGVIVGRRTFGKGLVQRPIPLFDGSMLRLTVARYYTPSGRSIQKPYEEGNEMYNKDLINRYNHGELTNADSIHFPDSLKYKTLRTDRVVYGGGGIMPDYFVPLDTTRYTDFHRNIIAKGSLNKYSINYIDENRKVLAKEYKTVEKYLDRFVVTDEMLSRLVDQGNKDSVKFDQEQFDKSKPLIQQQLKALIARDLFDMAAYFKVMNIFNDSFVKGLQVINNEAEYKDLLKDK